MSDDFDYSAFIGQFVEESQDHLKKLNSDLLALEEDPEKDEVMAEIVREAHTLKGAARMMGAEEIATVSHKLEDLLGEVKAGRLSLDTPVCDLLFESFDALDALLRRFAGKEGAEVDVDSLLERLQGWESAKERKRESAKERESGSAEVQKKGTKAVTPQSEIRDPQSKHLDETIRVSSSKLDSLANLAGEMVINRIRMTDRERDLKGLIDLIKSQDRSWKRLKDLAERLGVAQELAGDISLITNNGIEIDKEIYTLFRRWREDRTALEMTVSLLQQEVLEARMMPVSTLFETYHRPVRDLAKQFGKDVELKVRSGDTELDKMVIEGIKDPLIHIIRNAVDHGIELPDEREAQGKPRGGTITLHAKQEGEYVVIEVSDDGAGVDTGKVKEKAVKAGIVTEDEVARMSDVNLLQLVFRPGFSTSDILTEISGRGVGMDVVKEKAEELKGIAYLQTQAGQGTTVSIKVPLTLALSRVLFARVAGGVVGIPTTSVEETLRVKAEDIKTIEKKEAIVIRGHAVPLVRLARVLGIPEPPTAGRSPVLPAIVVDLAGNKVGFVVDDLIDEHEVVIKALGTYLKKVENIGGATILSSGDVVLILNVADLVSSVRGNGETAEVGVEEPHTVETLRILVVDDSMTAREVEKNVLSSAGYAVDEAVDGLEAWNRLKKTTYDLLVVDVQMPRLNGFDLTKRIKSDDRYKEIPVVIVTTLESEEDKRKGIDAGADAYIVKRSFDQANLLSEIERLIG